MTPKSYSIVKEGNFANEATKGKNAVIIILTNVSMMAALFV